MTASIPTMPCPECGGAGELAEHASDCGAYGACCGGIGVECESCLGTGRIPRPPLTPAEVAALPDGARVVVADETGVAEPVALTAQIRIAIDIANSCY